jgi:hypothetical protein
MKCSIRLKGFSIMEKKAEVLFRKYKQKYITKLGRHALDNVELDTFAKSVFGTKYKGSYAQDETFELRSGYYIINNDLQSGPGEHWLSVQICPKTAYIFDSFGRDPKKLVPHLTKRLTKSGRKIVSSDRTDREQRGSSVICGHLCLSFLSVSKDLGIRHAIKI